ncbi:acireductone synthase [Thiothrix subterranea]|uniref:Enolase-phosphatase E1 n=1 Tax=Thiothrix subterranea TaxID=2735563 RepID=A0AA51MP62_9GAMM|nr:acireductone synthase [Thiothrix subterranea]MDQ5768578.1 acireductone synthase [Thiothrix subterranea]WML87538.1 acireductone synthase [Thiothrix subterranea]
MSIKAILTDIEGTTTSLSFVKDVLFPYADQQMEVFVVKHRQDPQVAKLIDDVRLETGNAVLSLAEAIAQLRQWIADDKKITPLKAIQGLMWEEGYRNGDFTGHVYEDAVRHLLHWHELGLKLYVYSSGSVYAQKLLFGYSDAGDLTPLFSGYFDTAVGHKREAKSYQTIVEALDLSASEILFLSDIAEELDAAAQVGLKTCCLVRENQPTATLQHPWVKNFDELDVMSIT